MSGYDVFTLKDLLSELKEDRTRNILSSFLCPKNADVERFLHTKAIEFEKSGYSTTYLVYASYKDKPEMAGYFTLANKQFYITAKSTKQKVSRGNAPLLSNSKRRRLVQYGTYDKSLGIYTISAPLIGQLGKNFAINDGKLISGAELLEIACSKVWEIQRNFSGRVVYLECEDKPELVNFYSNNGFVKFGERELERDEKDDMDGEYLIQMLKDLKAYYEKSEGADS